MMSRAVDNIGERTLTVVTKCDVQPVLRHVLIADNISYTFVRNQINDETYVDARAQEANLFAIHPSLLTFDNSMVGIPVLADKLVDKLGKEYMWVKWVNVVKLKGSCIWDIEAKYNDSCGWKKLLELRNRIKAHVFYSIGDGRNVSMWFDKWDSNGPLCDIIPRREWGNGRGEGGAALSKGRLKESGGGINGNSNYPILCMIAAPYPTTLTEGTKDKVYWIDSHNVKKEFSTNQAWHDLRGNSEKVEWHHVIWFSQFQPRHAFILWLASKERLATQDRIAKCLNDFASNTWSLLARLNIISSQFYLAWPWEEAR
ncbi:RNA-directed DNA polymerase, eukaryota, reverse transcriptase zinc-binding domain protein [Tanacetum coccineum]